jgi:hypothetical protein
MLKAIEVIIEPNGIIRPLEALSVTVPTRAILTLNTQPQSEPSEKGSASSILKFLTIYPLPSGHQRSATEIDHQINEERSAWE